MYLYVLAMLGGRPRIFCIRRASRRIEGSQPLLDCFRSQSQRLQVPPDKETRQCSGIFLKFTGHDSFQQLENGPLVR
jgi:hypothetical protein